MSTNNLIFSNQFHDYGLPYESPGSASEFMTNLQYINQKIEATTKKITYWDLYKISTVLTNADAFYSSLNNLLPYSSMVINTRITNTKDGDLNPGDIVVKNSDGSHEIVRAERGGIFYPGSIVANQSTSNYTYQINYSYAPAAPDALEATSKQKEDEEIPTYECDYAKTMKFSDLIGGLVGSPYNKIYEPKDIKENNNQIELDFPNVLDENNDIEKLKIEPIVKSFHKTNELFEEVYYDFSIKEDSTQYIITFLDSSVLDLINKVVVK